MAPRFARDGEALETAERVPVLPLRDVVVFPYVVMPLLIGRAASLAAVEAAAAGDRTILLVAQRNGDVQEPAAADLHRVGVVARVHQLQRLPGGTVKVLVEGVARARVTRYANAAGLLRASVEPEPYEGVGAPAAARGAAPEEPVEALARRAAGLFEDYVALHRRIPDEVAQLALGAPTPERQAFAIAAHVSVRHDVRQRLLESPTLGDLLVEISMLLAAELELLRLERKIEEDVRGSLFRNQREFYLQEQLRAIHRELGTDDGDDADELAAAIEKKGLPEPVRARAMRELRKLRRSPGPSPEGAVARGFVEWIVALPWTERTDDVLDVAHARQVLDEDHYGLEEVKERILDYIAVLSLNGRLDGPILCLVGPPGVGKTSLGRSIARAIGRRFARLALGGVRDEAEIRGHRRTYIGAMPGRILQAMRRAEAVNPVLLLDEVDKLAHDYRGDPAAALLEVLDPEQNRAFSDHYLEVDYDLSQVLFVTTANSLSGIPDPLRDRMEIIRLPGYLDQEKLAIGRRHLVPKQLRAHGLDPARVTWDADALPAVLRGYTREAGVRDLERRIARVARKLARRVVEGPALAAAVAGGDDGPAAAAGAHDGAAPTAGDPPALVHAPMHVAAADLRELLGPAPFDPDDTSLEDKVGVATGLAYTSAGGETLEIEVNAVPGRGRLQLTGTLGDVMKESAHAAVSYARHRADELGLEADFHRTRDLHLHMPAGATPKDGPSAGIAIATAVISALTGRPVRGDIAMTGEISLRGRVLPVGGVREKLVAAHRARVGEVLVPAMNERDLAELPDEVKEGLVVHLVRSMDDVLALALRPATADAAPKRRPTRAPDEAHDHAGVTH